MISTEQILNGKILIVDDEPANVMVLEETLKQRGHTCIESITDPRHVIDTYKTYQPNLILLDLNMPHMDGFQVMEQIKETDPKGNVPVMVLTAQIDQGTRLRALDAGAKDFLTKPFDILEVSLRIQNMLEISLLYSHLRDLNKSLDGKYENTILELAATKVKLQNKIDQINELQAQLKSCSTNA